MAKVKFTLKAECFAANKNKNGSVITLVTDVTPTEKGPAAKTVINVNVTDPRMANDFETGKQYTITITE